MYPALDSVCLQSKVHVPHSTIAHVVLVEYIIQTLIEVLQVEQDHCATCLHTDLDLINVTTNLNGSDLQYIEL